ncbi:hypothetical protein WOLCODRAFT_159046 [Wolfiporia cocos MD-104 SS10]|uniref:Uncharacterized protein n=1 Tax=Wolfiporia cocos (strain MD-104) TaxID=742152 RepID=A0A2H3JL17_WOLCO|nr:hypothetical protein WOLCODRAFT_159046 [Wolfiporia cocos MD-104 SS10]
MESQQPNFFQVYPVLQLYLISDEDTSMGYFSVLATILKHVCSNDENMPSHQ